MDNKENDKIIDVVEVLRRKIYASNRNEDSQINALEEKHEVHIEELKLNKKDNKIVIIHNTNSCGYSYDLGTIACDFIQDRLDMFCDFDYDVDEIKITIF